MSRKLIHVGSYLWVFFPVVLFGFLFFLPRLPGLESYGIQIFDELFVLFSCAVIYISYGKPSWLWKSLALFLILCIFYLPLQRIWQSAASNFNTVLGIFPWSDASNYYIDALGMLHGGLYGPFSGYRPLFSSLLTVLLALTSENLQIILFIFVIINAFSAYVIVIELSNSFGPFVGTVTLFLLQMYYRLFAGSTMSEQLGMAIGWISLALLIIAFRKKDFKYFSAELFFFSFGLFVRPGAFFILPIITLLWLVSNSENKLKFFRNTILSAIIVLSVWQINAQISQVTSGPNSMPLGIFSYTLYGQAKGGAGWQQFFVDFPDLKTKSHMDAPNLAYKAAFAEISRHPAGLMEGVLKSYRDFISPGFNSTFGFIQFGNVALNLAIQIILLLFMTIGLIKCWLWRSNPVYSLILAITVGVFLSIPFVPPADAAEMRLYAVTIAIPCVLAAIGLDVTSKNRVVLPTVKNLYPTNGIIAAIFGLAVVGLAVSVIFIKINAKKPVINAITCPTGLFPVAFSAPIGSYLSIVRNETGLETKLPIAVDKDIRRSLQLFPGDYTVFIDTLRHAIVPPVIFTSTINFASGEGTWLVAPPEVLNIPGRIIQACGRYTDNSRKVIKIITYK